MLAGVATDIGIEFTARHALASGYYSVIVEDATGAYSDDAHARSITFFANLDARRTGIGNLPHMDEIASTLKAEADFK